MYILGWQEQFIGLSNKFPLTKSSAALQDDHIMAQWSANSSGPTWLYEAIKLQFKFTNIKDRRKLKICSKIVICYLPDIHIRSHETINTNVRKW